MHAEEILGKFLGQEKKYADILSSLPFTDTILIKTSYTSPRKEHVDSLHFNRSNVFPQIGSANEN